MALKGKRQLEARLKAIGQTDLLLREIVIHGVREAKLAVPRKTGNLGRTIRVGTVTKTTGSIKAGGVRNVGYAHSVEFGTRPHVIRPRSKKVLAWGGPRTLSGRLRAGGKPTHFARSVRHPGSKAKPYLVPGLRKAALERGIESIVALWNRAS